MRFSNYNIFVNLFNENYIYNSFTGALIKINTLVYNKLKDDSNSFNKFSDDELVFLKNNGIIIEENMNELKLIEEKMDFILKKKEILTLTIAPTLDCNFNCYYCFEKHEKGKMSQETANSLFDFIVSEIKSGIKIIKIIWYGGEPLLEIDFITNFMKQLFLICKKYNVSCFSGMITNGFLLNEINCRKLKNLNLSTLQVTLDGEPEVHNKRRTLKNSPLGTFDTILENLRIAKQVGLNISIRINIDMENIISNENLLKILYQNGLNDFKIDLGYVENFNFLNCSSIVEKDNFYTYKLEFNKLLSKYNFKTLELFPKQNAIFCGAYNSKSFVINWDGNIFKCWSDIGNKNYSLGNINMVNPALLENKRYDFNDIFKSECLECNILPICAGGCPHLFLKEGNRKCSIYKYKLKEILERKILNFKEEKNGNNY